MMAASRALSLEQINPATFTILARGCTVFYASSMLAVEAGGTVDKSLSLRSAFESGTYKREYGNTKFLQYKTRKMTCNFGHNNSWKLSFKAM